MGAKCRHAVAWSGSRGAEFQWLLPKRPTPERCVEAYYLRRTRFESIAERKLRGRQLSKDGNVEDKRAGLAPGVAQSDIARSNGLSYLHIHEPRKRIGGVYYCDRPTAMPMNTRNHELAGKSTIAWRRHELLSKAIFEALLKQSDAQNLDIKHNVTVKGTKTAHQIDVLWKFRMGGLDHYVIVQVKKQKWRAKKGDLLLFQSVLLDIPGQPKGVFVSERGYQKGALEVAHATGITAFEIREVDRDAAHGDITMTNFSILTLTQRPDQVAMEFTILEPTITDVRMTLDGPWWGEHPEARESYRVRAQGTIS